MTVVHVFRKPRLKTAAQHLWEACHMRKWFVYVGLGKYDNKRCLILGVTRKSVAKEMPEMFEGWPLTVVHSGAARPAEVLL